MKTEDRFVILLKTSYLQLSFIKIDINLFNNRSSIGFTMKSNSNGADRMKIILLSNFVKDHFLNDFH